MKKILIFLLSIASISTFGQSGSIAISGVKYRVNDTTAYQSAVATAHAQGYADIYWNNQATTPHWDIWNGSSYDHIFDFGSGSTYTAGSGLTLTADQFKLGGTITENTTFSNNGFNVTHASSGTRMGAFRIWATTIGLDGSTSAFIQSGDNTVTTSAASGVDIVGDSVRLATDGSQIRLNTDGSLSIDGDVGTSGQVITSNGAGPLTWETPSGGGTWGSITGTLSDQTDLQSALDAKADKRLTANTQTSNYTIVLTDDGKRIVMNNGSAAILTVPPASSVAWTTGAWIPVESTGAGSVTFAAGSGVTINPSSTGSLSHPGRYNIAGLLYEGSDVWTLTNGGPPPSSGNGVAWTGSGTSFNLGALTGNANISGAFGLGRNVSPTALFHIGAGTATAGTAPLKFTDGTQLTTSESLVLEPETGGENLLFTNQSNTFRKTVMAALVGSGTLNFPSITANGGTQTLTITVTGAATSDEVILGVPSASITAGVTWFAYVNATNSVTVVATNCTAGALDPASGSFKVSVIKR